MLTWGTSAGGFIPKIADAIMAVMMIVIVSIIMLPTTSETPLSFVEDILVLALKKKLWKHLFFADMIPFKNLITRFVYILR